MNGSAKPKTPRVSKWRVVERYDSGHVRYIWHEHKERDEVLAWFRSCVPFRLSHYCTGAVQRRVGGKWETIATFVDGATEVKVPT